MTEVRVDPVHTDTLPLLTLTTGVLLPQMVVTIVVDTAEAEAAIDAALGGDKRLLVVPRLAERYSSVGTIVTSPGHSPTSWS